MNRTYRPGEIILDSRGTWFVRRDGSFVRFDPARRSRRTSLPHTRRRDDRLFIV